jgi:hypothetical protein
VRCCFSIANTLNEISAARSEHFAAALSPRMFKVLRQTKAKLAATSTASGADADDTKTVAEIRAAAATLKRTLGYYYKSFLDHNANTAALHEDVANLYPASERLSMAVATLNQGSNIFHDSAALVEEMKGTIERPLDELVALCDATLAKIERRAAARAEIEYYKSKVVNLANEAKAANDAKKEAKAESNQQKLQSVQAEFRSLQDEVGATLARIDAEVARTINGSVASYMQMMSNYSNGLLHCFGSALAAVPVAGGAAAAASAAATAASPAAAAAGGGGAARAAPAVAAGAPAAAAAAAAAEGGGEGGEEDAEGGDAEA